MQYGQWVIQASSQQGVDPFTHQHMTALGWGIQLTEDDLAADGHIYLFYQPQSCSNLTKYR
jgi:hypothetical protein